MATYRGDGTPTAGDDFPTNADLEQAVVDAEQSATDAAASASAASISESNAALSETNAATSASNAATSETNAAASESAAATSAANAATSESNAATSASDAAATLVLVEGIYDEFDDRYLGSKAVDPTLDNDGDPLLTGALYWNTSGLAMRVYNGTAWESVNQDSYTKTESDAKYAILANANTFTAAQTLDGTNSNLIHTPDADTDSSIMGDKYTNDVGVDQWTSGYLPSTKEFRLFDHSTGLTVIEVEQGAAKLVLTSTDGMQFAGSEVAREGRINTFTSSQRISSGAPEIVLNETDSTDLNWGWRVNAGVVALSRYTDAYGLAADKIRVDTNASQLTMDANKLGYDNGQVPVHSGVATHNLAYTFVADDYRFHSYHSTGAHTWTIPPNSSVAFPIGTILEIVNAVGTLTIGRGTGVVLSAIGNGGFLGDANKTIASGYTCKLLKWATDQWFVLHSGGVT